MLILSDNKSKKNKLYFYKVPLAEILDNNLNLKEKRIQLKKYKFELLSLILKTPISEQDIRYTLHGKPFIEHIDFSFSISHSQDYYAIVWAYQKVKLGLDIESLARKIRLKTIRQICSSVEWLDFVNHGKKINIFLQKWTQKEAFIKSNGLTIFSGVNQMEFKPVKDVNLEKNKNIVKATFDGELYQMLPLNFNHHVGTICTQLDYIKELVSGL